MQQEGTVDLPLDAIVEDDPKAVAVKGLNVCHFQHISDAKGASGNRLPDPE
jgi:hypothetical protein